MKITFSFIFIILTIGNLFAQKDGIYIFTPFEFIVEDSLGRKTGDNPVIPKACDEIPNAGYSKGGFPGHNIAEFIYYPTKKEKLLLKPMNIGNWYYDLNIQISRGKNENSLFLRRGICNANKIDEFEIFYDPDTTKPVWVVKKVNDQTFLRDLGLCFEMKFINDETTFRQLYAPATEYHSSMLRKDYYKAFGYLNIFKNKLLKLNETEITKGAV